MGLLQRSSHHKTPNTGDIKLGMEGEKDLESEIAVPTRSSMPVTYQDITYSVKNSANKKERINLLQGVSGCILPGRLTALMGPSGSGKTTLLDVLAGRKTVGKIEGKILFAGHKPSKQFLRRFSSYVEQFDTLIPNLTVSEMLGYTVELKLESSIPFAEKMQKVEAVIQQLNLHGCRDVIIGNAEQRGISGGQSKRTNVALALVSNPRVLFLDEPTSGLDSYTANEVLAAVKELVHSGIAIVSTIHSPTSFCFSLFDSLTLLLRGRVVYSGAQGEAAISYFKQTFPQILELGKEGAYQNPAEWIVDITTKADRDGKYLEFAEAHDGSDRKQTVLREVEKYSTNTDDLSEETLKELSVQRATTNGFFFTLKTLIKYRTLKDLRTLDYIAPRAADKFIFSLIVMSLYWKVGKRLESSQVNNQVSVLFMWAVLPAYAAAAYIPSIVMERGLFCREISDGLHRPIAYLCYKLLGEISVMLFVSLGASALVFYTVALQGSFFFFWVCYLLTSLVGISLGYLIAAASSTMEIANVVLPLYVTVLLFFTGLLITPSDQPAYWHWFSYTDFIHYAWGGMMINQYKGTKLSGALGYGGVPVLEFYSLAESNKWEQFGWLCFFFAAFFSLAWFALAYKRLQRR